MAWIIDRTAQDYKRVLKQDFDELAKSVIEKKGRVRVLDIGAGKGFFLRSLKEKFKDKIETVGMYLEQPEGRIQGIDRVVIGSIDFKKPSGRFDIITSVMGSRYALSQATVLQRVCNSLSLNGVAFLHLPADFKSQPLVDKLNASGLFKAEPFTSKARKHYKRALAITCIRIEKLKAGRIDFSREMEQEWHKLQRKKFRMPLIPTRKGFPKLK